MSAQVVNHVGHCVRSLEASTRFYVETLGFKEWHQLAVPDSAVTTLLSLEKPIGLNAVYLYQGPFVLELLQFDKELVEQPDRVMNEPGLTHLSISVEDLPATLAKVVELGGTVIADIRAAAMVLDPDGQRIELLPLGYRDSLPPRKD